MEYFKQVNQGILKSTWTVTDIPLTTSTCLVTLSFLSSTNLKIFQKRIYWSDFTCETESLDATTLLEKIKEACTSTSLSNVNLDISTSSCRIAFMMEKEDLKITLASFNLEAVESSAFTWIQNLVSERQEGIARIASNNTGELSSP